MFNTDFNLGLLAGHNIWQSVIIFAVVFIILKVIQGSSAEEKSWSWSATLLALAILPMAAFLPGEGFTWQQDLALSERSVSQIEFVAPLQFEQNSTNLIIPQEAQKPFITMEKIQTSLIILWFIGTLISLFKLAVAGYNAAKLRSSAYPFVTENDNWQSDVIDAAVPYYGTPARTDIVGNVRGPIMGQLAEDDERVNTSWGPYEEVMKANNVPYTKHIYPGTRHGFHNDSTGRFNEEMAQLSWDRTLAFFGENLKG
ncbi:MAG: hypothetical protein HOJ34_11330 [Kordiimonadaceae bacterium]|nr:hypothetical protein [Kordiimonadaceae bacterium]MBT6330364.1 hypothetical protein [Kordiimonadaceae bacterium]MBT7583855.1 hypothetical protein [Kordiimonadaceae bacterium]